MKRTIKILLALLFVINLTYAQNKYNRVPTPEFSVYHELPITDISPDLWLKSFLITQKKGLTGHIEAAGFPYDLARWNTPKNPSENISEDKIWWPYEQTAYWIDGALRTGYFLHDTKFVDSIRTNILYVLKNASEKGVLGPLHIGKIKWPHAVFFRAMIAEYYASGNEEIIDKLIKHFIATKGEYTDDRDFMNVETICWLYGISGNKTMLSMAEEMYEDYCLKNNSSVTLKNLLSDAMPEGHGVSFCESIKIPAILYMYTGKEIYLKAAVNGLEKLDYYHVLVDGVPSSTEFLNGKRSNNAHETCDISDFIWSLSYMLMATGDAKWADKLEKVAYNAGPGAVTKDFKGHQYYSSPNQFLADDFSSPWNSRENWFVFEKGRMAYRPFHGTECCSGNVNRFMPNLISRMWLTDSIGGIVAALFAPATLTTTAGNKKEKVEITENTNYPFGSKIEFLFRCGNKNGIEFPFSIRIPDWSKNTSISINGKQLNENIINGYYFTINRKVKTGDKIEVNFSAKPEIQFLPGNGIALSVGALLFSYSIPSSTKLSETYKAKIPGFDPLQFQPTADWNYALDLESDKLSTDIEVINKPMPENPWIAETTPVTLRVPAWKISGWFLENGVTPDLPVEYKKTEKEFITLVPLGSTTLRLTIFPDIKKRFTLSQLSQ
jgi:uncharacterized protein